MAIKLDDEVKMTSRLSEVDPALISNSTISSNSTTNGSLRNMHNHLHDKGLLKIKAMTQVPIIFILLTVYCVVNMWLFARFQRITEKFVDKLEVK